MANKLFTQEERDAVDTVIGMGLHITNAYAETMKDGGCGAVEIENRMFETKEYKSISTALTQFLKEKE